MKKEEKIQYINSESQSLAKTGDYSGWHMIEVELRSQGYPEARWVLDDRRKRKELDELCNIAQSEEETVRREKFKTWKEKIIEECKNEIELDEESISLSSIKDYLLISCSKFDAFLVKKFNSDLVVIDKFRIFENSHAKVFSNITPKEKLKIDEVNCNKIQVVIESLYKKAINF